jgi:hypothetical protein
MEIDVGFLSKYRKRNNAITTEWGGADKTALPTSLFTGKI